jgi:hypothetical protein
VTSSLGTECLKCAKLFCFDDKPDVRRSTQVGLSFRPRPCVHRSFPTDRVTFYNWTLVARTITTTWFCQGKPIHQCCCSARLSSLDMDFLLHLRIYGPGCVAGIRYRSFLQASDTATRRLHMSSALLTDSVLHGKSEIRPRSFSNRRGRHIGQHYNPDRQAKE